MDAAEIEVYKQKLGEVELALSADPNNSELQQLKGEIEDLLSLSAQLQPEAPQRIESDRKQQPAGARCASSTDEGRGWQIGDTCEARYKDGKYYPARVVAVRAHGVYQVTFVGYSDIQEVAGSEMRAAAGGGKRARGAKGVAGSGKVGKQHKGKTRGGVAASGQQSWLKFAKESKKLRAKAINDKSIFKSPDTADGKVGVVNSGKGMTQNPRPTKL
ncbi:hypothetical protein LPJ61_002697 [Coemansia biformis]|uniref:Tudor domain-containing protein n=1 Tax=Coemansia biformis TaxID=1286918 RepID=A0A9W8CYF2_9FUNG|nr:hypothetical protein LPJ61_002697 [Coemansia biformis]